MTHPTNVVALLPRRPSAQAAVDRVFPGRAVDSVAEPQALARILAASEAALGEDPASAEVAYQRIVAAFREFRAAVLNGGAQAQLRFSAVHGAEATRYGPVTSTAERMWADAERYRWLKAQSPETLGAILIRRQVEHERLDRLVDEQRRVPRRPSGRESSSTG